MWTKHPCNRWARSGEMGMFFSVLGTQRWRSIIQRLQAASSAFDESSVVSTQLSPPVLIRLNCSEGSLQGGTLAGLLRWKWSGDPVVLSTVLLSTFACSRGSAVLFLFLSPIGRSGTVSCFHSNRCRSLGPPSTSSLARPPGVFWVKCCKRALCKCL